MSETLNQPVGLEHEISRLNRESATRRIRLRETKKELESAHASLAESKALAAQLTEERDTYEAAFAEIDGKMKSAPNELQAEIDRLHSQIRERDHKDMFKQVASESRVRPEAIEDLYRISGYKPENDVPDPEAIRSAIVEMTARKSYLLIGDAKLEAVPPPPTNPPGRPLAPRAEPPVSGRGAPVNSSGFIVTTAQTRDATWMRRNQAKLAAASKAGELTMLDE